MQHPKLGSPDVCSPGSQNLALSGRCRQVGPLLERPDAILCGNVRNWLTAERENVCVCERVCVCEMV